MIYKRKSENIKRYRPQQVHMLYTHATSTYCCIIIVAESVLEVLIVVTCCMGNKPFFRVMFSSLFINVNQLTLTHQAKKFNLFISWLSHKSFILPQGVRYTARLGVGPSTFFVCTSMTCIDPQTSSALFILLTIQQFLHPTLTLTVFMPQWTRNW